MPTSLTEDTGGEQLRHSSCLESHDVAGRAISAVPAGSPHRPANPRTGSAHVLVAQDASSTSVSIRQQVEEAMWLQHRGSTWHLQERYLSHEVLDAIQCHHPPRTADYPSEMRKVQAFTHYVILFDVQKDWLEHKNDDVFFQEALTVKAWMQLLQEGVPREWWAIEPRFFEPKALSGPVLSRLLLLICI